MTAKRIIVSAIVMGFLALTVAFVMLWYPTEPSPPTSADLARLESGFPALRGALERIVAFEQQEQGYRLLAHDRASQYDPQSKAYKAYMAYLERERRLLAGTRPPMKRVDVMSDSLIYIWGWARRGHGFIAGWAFAGYAYSTRPLASTPQSPRKHLEGPWYLVSTVR
jgi:hypothetical protein